MKKIVTLCLILSSCIANAVVINAQTQDLYIGNGISCGRYTLNQGVPINDVQSFCNVLGSASYTAGKYWLEIQTQQYGPIECSFIGGKLSQCYKNN